MKATQLNQEMAKRIFAEPGEQEMLRRVLVAMGKAKDLGALDLEVTFLQSKDAQNLSFVIRWPSQWGTQEIPVQHETGDRLMTLGLAARFLEEVVCKEPARDGS